MIRSSFNFIPGIGDKTELKLWSEGVFSWEDLHSNISKVRIDIAKKIKIEDYLQKATDAIKRYDADFFAVNLSKKDYWKLYKEFSGKTLFLDIETTGLSRYYDKITLIGTFDGFENKYFIKDINFNELPDYLKNYQVIVTFNGTLFDIPFIRKEFHQIWLPPIHIDLRYLLRSIGLPGPLKKVEPKLQLQRPPEVSSFSGRDAVVLWNRYLNGEDSALEKLLLYNTCDTVNLKAILHYCYNQKSKDIVKKMKSAIYQMELGAKPKELKEDYILETPILDIPHISIRQNNGSLDVYMNGKKVLNVNRKFIQRNEIKLDDLLEKINTRKYRAVSVGIDLTGSEKRASGVCVLDGYHAYLELLKTDEEIIDKIQKVGPAIVSIDSPLGLPRGRCCPNDACECRIYGIMRECERILKKRGINVYPCLIPSMQGLTMRGINLARILRDKGYDVIESYPGAAQDVLGLPRKRVDLKALEIDLMNMGIQPVSAREIITHDEIDALTSALVGYFYQAGQYEDLGNSDEGFLIIPSINNTSNQHH